MKYLISIASILIALVSFAQDKNEPTDSTYEYTVKPIQWMTWDQAMTARSIKEKKIFVFIEDDSQPLSLKMDSVVFMDTVVNVYLNDYYYCVRLNSQMKDTILFRNRELYYTIDPKTGDGYHSLVSNLMGFKYQFPALVIFDEKLSMLRRTYGYVNKNITGRMLSQFAHDEHLNPKVQKFGQNYQCLNPNHPHNRLRQMSLARQQRENNKKEQ